MSIFREEAADTRAEIVLVKLSTAVALQAGSRRRRLASLLRALFDLLDISQASYAAKTHIDPSALSRWLSGSRMPRGSGFIDQLLEDVALRLGDDRVPDNVAMRVR